MKHLVSIMAVFLLMGCQTTEISAAKDISSPEEPVAEQTTEAEPKVGENGRRLFQSMKPVLCADVESVHDGIKEGSGEEPFMIWRDVQNTYTTTLWMNHETKTVTLIEYVKPGIGCFSAVGVDATISKKSIGTQIKYEQLKTLLEQRKNIIYSLDN